LPWGSAGGGGKSTSIGGVHWAAWSYMKDEQHPVECINCPLAATKMPPQYKKKLLQKLESILAHTTTITKPHVTQDVT
jgi:hypothetical protein